MGNVRRMMRAESSCPGGVRGGPGRGVGRLGAECGMVECGSGSLGWGCYYMFVLLKGNLLLFG